jgi:D-alanine-D-alanine ligase
MSHEYGHELPADRKTKTTSLEVKERIMKQLKVLVLFDTAGAPPEDQDFSNEMKTEDWKTERNVIHALKKLGHEVFQVGIYDDIAPLERAIKESKPDIVFNLAEQFRGDRALDRDIVAYLELIGIPYTGSGPAGMLLCRDKGICKNILSYHRIRNPRFAVFTQGRKVRRQKRLGFPLFVKPVREDASQGISQASFIEDDETLAQRVQFIHESVGDDAIAESYIDGRELYVSILGNERLKVFPIREITFHGVSDDDPKIATYKAKWDPKYRRKWGITNRFAKNIPDDVRARIENICKRTYRLLHIRGWGRIDLRLTPDNEVVIIEANPNPFLAKEEDFAESAMRAGYSYEKLMDKILGLGLNL